MSTPFAAPILFQKITPKTITPERIENKTESKFAFRWARAFFVAISFHLIWFDSLLFPLTTSLSTFKYAQFYQSFFGAFTSSINTTKRLPSTGPNTSLVRFSVDDSIACLTCNDFVVYENTIRLLSWKTIIDIIRRLKHRAHSLGVREDTCEKLQAASIVKDATHSNRKKICVLARETNKNQLLHIWNRQKQRPENQTSYICVGIHIFQIIQHAGCFRRSSVTNQQQRMIDLEEADKKISAQQSHSLINAKCRVYTYIIQLV